MKHYKEIYSKSLGRFITTFAGVIFILIFSSSQLLATTNETINPGSYIIDMGQQTQTVDNGLLPYGLIYQLIVTENVPVKWAISESKVKDGTDFIADGKSYRGSAFIIPVENLTSDVENLITAWINKGVVVDGPTSNSFTAPIYVNLTSWPEILVNDKKPEIVEDYFNRAEIPTNIYEIGSPDNLDDCHDLFLMPHSKPHTEWSNDDKTEFLLFMNNRAGFLWAACETTGNLEGEMSSDYHFLSQVGLQTTGQHDDGDLSYTYDALYDSDPIMQFIGTFDGATDKGSERIYMPEKGNDWRTSTSVAVFQPFHSDADDDEATVLVYGPTKGIANSGMVLYQAGHEVDIEGTLAEQVAAQRAFLNFILLAGVENEINVNPTVPTDLISGTDVNVSVSASGGSNSFVYEWTSTCSGGSFDNSTSASTTYTPPVVTASTTCVITVKVTDDCGRFSFESTTVTVSPIAGPTAVDDAATTPMNTAVDIDALDNDTEGSASLDPTSVSFVSGTEPDASSEGTFTVDGTTGLVTFTPFADFTGTVTIDYEVCDLNSLCDEATITVVISTVTGPTAIDDNATTTLNTPVDIDALDNDTEGAAALDPTSVTFIPGTGPPSSEGVFTVNSTTGLVTFTPANGYSGAVDIDYEVCDLNNLCAQATINVFISNGADTDGDGCTDDVDEYPNDPTRCFNNYYPAAGNGTLAYEDLWPGRGDYDFNDLVIDYRFLTVTNGSNMIVETFGTFIVKAFGATLQNGFGFQFANDNISDEDVLSVSGYDLQEGYISLGANGIEDGQSKPTIIVYDNAFNIMPQVGGGIGVNTDPNQSYVEPETLDIHITYAQGEYTLAQLDMPNFNPFLIVNMDRGVEVHLPNYTPTDLVDVSHFGTFNDDSNPATGKYYKTENNLPWAINITEPFNYPI
ncbi:MAG: LruC domain-containing protein, partial [Bacteroidota bacterium]